MIDAGALRLHSFIPLPAVAYGTIDTGLFDAIVKGAVPQAPGPKENQNDAR